jgi:arabinofuranosyltransferase
LFKLPKKLSTLQVSAIIAAICGIVALFFLGRFAFDDLYISFRYAEHLANGNGLTWNIGQAPVEGYTNFLLVLILAVIHLAGVDPLISIQVFSVVLAAVSAVLLARLALSLFDDKDSGAARTAAILTSIAYCFNPFVWQNALSGLETTLFAFLILWSIVLLQRAHESGSSYLGGFFVATLSMLARPDGILFGVLATLVFFWLSSRRSKVAIASLLGFVIPAILYELWRIAYFGSPLPNTFYVKVSNAINVFAGRSYVSTFYKTEILLVILVIVGVWRLKKNPVFVISILWIIGLSIFYLVPTPIQGFYFRFLFSVMVLLTLVGVCSLVNITYKLKENYRWALLTVAICGHLLLNWRMAKGEEIQAVIPEATAMYREMGEMLRSMPGSDSVSFAYQDAGVVPYYSNMRHYDLVGLNDTFIGHQTDPGKIIQYLSKEKPDIYLLPAERPGINDSCWRIFRQGHGRMGQLGPAIVESDLLNDYTQIGRYLYIGYDILVYVRSNDHSTIGQHIRQYPYKELTIAGVVPCFR